MYTASASGDPRPTYTQNTITTATSAAAVPVSLCVCMQLYVRMCTQLVRLAPVIMMVQETETRTVRISAVVVSPNRGERRQLASVSC